MIQREANRGNLQHRFQIENEVHQVARTLVKLGPIQGFHCGSKKGQLEKYIDFELFNPRSVEKLRKTLVFFLMSSFWQFLTVKRQFSGGSG